jgi:hypothetical protein
LVFSVYKTTSLYMSGRFILALIIICYYHAKSSRRFQQCFRGRTILRTRPKNCKSLLVLIYQVLISFKLVERRLHVPVYHWSASIHGCPAAIHQPFSPISRTSAPIHRTPTPVWWHATVGQPL